MTLDASSDFYMQVFLVTGLTAKSYSERVRCSALLVEHSLQPGIETQPNILKMTMPPPDSLTAETSQNDAE